MLSGVVCAAATFFAYNKFQSQAKFDYSTVVIEPFKDLDFAKMDDNEFSRTVMQLVLSRPGLLFMKVDSWEAARGNNAVSDEFVNALGHRVQAIDSINRF